MNFLLQKIAEKEDIKVSQEEVAARVQAMATMYQIPAEKFVKDLQKRNGIVEIYDQIAGEKVLAFLQQHAQARGCGRGCGAESLVTNGLGGRRKGLWHHPTCP